MELPSKTFLNISENLNNLSRKDIIFMFRLVNHNGIAYYVIEAFEKSFEDIVEILSIYRG